MAPFYQQKRMFVIFGRPGAGKTTIADAASTTLSDGCLRLDLDVCVPDWMKQNFQKNLYPTLKERREFAISCCEYVDRELQLACSEPKIKSVLISFSFVNTDLRDIFRTRFPDSVWILVDVDDATAQKRMKERQNHFYKGKQQQAVSGGGRHDESASSRTADHDNSDWEFAPVDFEHELLNGYDSVEINCKKLLDIIRRDILRAS